MHYLLTAAHIFAGSSNGRTAAFEAVNLGSNPSLAAKKWVSEYATGFINLWAGGGMVYATDLKSVDRKIVGVRLPPSPTK